MFEMIISLLAVYHRIHFHASILDGGLVARVVYQGQQIGTEPPTPYLCFVPIWSCSFFVVFITLSPAR